MKKQILLSLILASSIVSVGYAAEEVTASENTSTVKASDVQKAEEKVGDIDDEITNARMRATLGSKSKWSFKSALGYNGGSVEKPFAETRPNYRAGASREALPQLAGTVGINYRVNEKDNISLATGLVIMAPLDGDITKPAIDKRRGANNETLPRYQVSTPSIGWSRGYRAMGAQMISDATVSYYSDSDSADINALGDFSISQTILADFGSSNWSGGVSFIGGVSVYGGDIKNDEVLPYYQAGAYKRDNLSLGLYPFAEYTFNETYSFRTVFGYAEFMNYKDEFNNSTAFFQKEPYQSMGIGISVTRDIYLYPNVQFTPKDIRGDRTNVALSTNINLF